MVRHVAQNWPWIYLDCIHSFPRLLDDYQLRQDIVMFFQQTIQKIPSTPVWTAREEAFEKGTRRPLAWLCFVPLEIHGTEKKRWRRRRRRRSSDTCVHFCALAWASSVSGWRETSACASVVSLFLGCPFEFIFYGSFFYPFLDSWNDYVRWIVFRADELLQYYVICCLTYLPFDR